MKTAISQSLPWLRPTISTFVVAAALAAALTSGGCTQQLSPATTSPSPGPTPTPNPNLPNFGRVFIIMMENKSYDQIIGAADAPYINKLATDYGLAARYYAVAHPSLPNYLAITSGSTQGETSDCADCSFDAQNIVDQLEANGKTWKAYAEDLPHPCFNGTSAGSTGGFFGRPLYVRRHNPLMYYKDISDDKARCDRVVPLSEFSSDLQNNQLPDYVWITPNTIHDMHDGTIRDGDNWLSSFVPPILASPAWQNGGVLFVVWDEGTDSAGCCGNAAGGHTVALVVAAQGKKGYKSETPYTHYSVLRTIEDAWHLGHLGHANDPGTHAMADFFQPSPSG